MILQISECYPPRSSSSVDNTLLDLQNSSYPTQPHSIIANFFFPRGHGNESCNLIGSYRGPDFPISNHGHGNGGKQRA